MKKPVRSLFAPFLLSTLALSASSFVAAEQPNQGTAVTNSTLQSSIRAFLEPESGLNSEIRAGLARLEQTCELTNKNNSAIATISTPSSKSSLITKDIAAARLLLIEQQGIIDKAIAEFRSKQSLNSNSCATLPSILRISESCTRFQKNSEIAQAVSQASQTYYSESLARYKSYEAALELETKGCTRPEFAYKLWVSEQVHLVPKLKTSGQQLSELLK